MAKKHKKGLRIGGYTITWLGLCILLILVALIAVGVLAATGHLGSLDGTRLVFSAPTESPTPEPTATPVPATPTPVPTPTPTPEPRDVSVRVLGEITMDTDLLKSVYDRQTSTFDFSPMFSMISDVAANADYTIADVEGVMTRNAVSGENGRLLTPPSLLDALKDIGVDMLMLGNDHAMDGGTENLMDEIANVEAAGFDYVGTAPSIEDKVAPKLTKVGGFNVGFVSYTEGLNVDESSISAGDLAYCVNIVSRSNAESDIRALRSAGAEVIIAILNWGDMYSPQINESQQTIAKYLASTCGVDVILGYHPATAQAVTWIENPEGENIPARTLCMYAPGNFLSSQRENGLNCGYVFQFSMRDEDGRVVVDAPVYIPTYVLCYADEEGQNQYRTLAAGQWTDDAASRMPEGMNYKDIVYMGELWTQIQKVMTEGGNIAEIARE